MLLEALEAITTQLTQFLIVLLVLNPVRRFLCPEGGDFRLELRILDAVLEVHDAVDEELLTEREQQRHRVEPGSDKSAVAVPFTSERRLNVESLAARTELEAVRAVALWQYRHTLILSSLAAF